MVFSFIQNLIDEANKRNQEKQEKIQKFLDSFSDEIVKKTSFLPLVNGGASFKTHTLKTDSFWNMIFQVKIWFPLIFVWAFSIPLFAVLIKLVTEILNQEIIYNLDTFAQYFWELLFWGLLSWAFFALFYFIFRSKIFDFQNGYFYDLRYQKKIFELLNNEKYRQKFTPLNTIHALQILSERVSWKNSSYTSYELNMICKDSSRVNIIDHGNLDEIRRNAQEIASRLWVKVYDITQVLQNESY